ncbi:transglutaminase-like domain-containing protein [Schumannella soli]|uniref:Transglutaminase domain-containing protein n=1 Tax=Schumannella soli TaxID=2590779 RepID=A0A506YBG9_9MICO|nr:transglutaminase-like domain-containing protein [Schumannella soli]TPW77829.1 transglutaminase domain-containing protein [Schumannella soli]
MSGVGGQGVGPGVGRPGAGGPGPIQPPPGFGAPSGQVGPVPAPGPKPGPRKQPRGPRRNRRRAESRAGLLQRAVAVAFVLLGLAVATALAWPIFQTPRLILVAAVAGVVGAAIPLVAGWRRWPALAGICLVALAFVALVVPLAVPSGLASPSALLNGLRDGIAGIVLGWKQLLTLELPLGDYQAVLVPFLLVALVGTALATALATAPGSRAIAAAPVVLLMSVFGIAFGPTSGGTGIELLGTRIGAVREMALGLVALALALTWLVVRARLIRRAALARARVDAGITTRGRSPIGALVRRRMLVVGLLGVALVAGLAVTPALAGVTPRSTLRTGAEPQLILRAQSTPLSQYRGAFTADAYSEPLFSVRGLGSGGAGNGADGAGGTAGDRIRLAVLDSWTGAEFRVGDDERFTRLPGGTPATGSRPVTITIEKGLDGVWMPLPDGVQSAPAFAGSRSTALADGFYLDRDSGAGIQIAPSTAGRGVRDGDSYTVQVAPSRDVELGAPGRSSLLDTAAYPQLNAWLKAQKQPRTADGYRELVERLRERGYLTHSLDDDAAAKSWIAALSKQTSYSFQPAYAGHSAARVETLFKQLVDQQDSVGETADPELLVAALGDDEQFATAAALLGRALGYESRVVVGVRMSGLKGSGVGTCDGTCTGSDLAAWVEVRSPGAADWTVIDAEPQFEKLPTIVTTGRQLPKNATVPEQPKVDTVRPPTDQHDESRSGQRPADDGGGLLGALLPFLKPIGLGAAALLLLALPALVLLVAKRLRRRARRGAAVPEVAVVGAWAELVDTWIDGGVDAGPGTRRDQAGRLGSPHASRLAVLADHAVFAEHPPTRQSVAEAWRLVDAELARRTESLRWRHRLRAAVTPVSFLRALNGRMGA